MKTSVVALFLALSDKRASAWLAPSVAQRVSSSLSTKPKSPSTIEDEFVQRTQKQWQEEAEHLHQYEAAAFTDPDLDGLVEEAHKAPNPVHMEKEQHRHTSLYNEVEHSIENDADLSNVIEKPKKDHSRKVNTTFREAEKHRHASLYDEVQHSIDTDENL
jgi:hypothetical protein